MILLYGCARPTPHAAGACMQAALERQLGASQLSSGRPGAQVRQCADACQLTYSSSQVTQHEPAYRHCRRLQPS